MKVNPLLSLGAKLFYLTTALVIMSVSLLTWQNTKYFTERLNEQFRTSSMTDGAVSGSTIEGILRGWDTQLQVMMLQTILVPDLEKRVNDMQEFIVKNDDFLAAGIYREKNDGLESLGMGHDSNTADKIFSGKNPLKIFALIDAQAPKKIELVQSGKNKEIEVFSLFRDTGLPVMLLARRLKDKNTKDIYWGVLVAKIEGLTKTLKNTDLMQSVVIDSKGKVFATLDEKKMAKGVSYNDLEIVKLSKRGTDSGYLGRYADSWGNEWLGSFYNIPKFGLTVLVQGDAKANYAVIQQSVMRTVKLGILFVLIAILFSYFGSTGVTRNLRVAMSATQKIAAGDFNANLKATSSDEVGVLTVSVNMMARQIKNLMASQAQKVRFEKELETAHAVQNTLFPKHQDHRGPIAIVGYSTPASECGGDWWGHFAGEDGLEYVFIADAMGHGVPAALVTAMAYSSCRTIVTSNSLNLEDRRSPKKILEQFNKVLYDAVEGSISMTLFAMVIDYKNNKVTYSNAGHNFPILLPADPEDDRVHKKIKSLQKISPLTPVSLQLAGDSLGITRDAILREESMPLRPGDKFILFTDGLIECTSPQGKAWGRKTLLEKVLLNADKGASDFKNGLIKDATNFFNGQPLADDVTVVVVEYRQESQLTATDPSVASQFGGIPPLPIPALPDDELQIITSDEESSDSSDVFDPLKYSA